MIHYERVPMPDKDNLGKCAFCDEMDWRVDTYSNEIERTTEISCRKCGRNWIERFKATHYDI